MEDQNLSKEIEKWAKTLIDIIMSHSRSLLAWVEVEQGIFGSKLQLVWHDVNRLDEVDWWRCAYNEILGQVAAYITDIECVKWSNPRLFIPARNTEGL
jgi:hypothetical protein